MRPVCGACVVCLRITNRICQPPSRGLAVPGLKPTTRQQLLNHAKKYGWDQVRETAGELGISLERKRSRRRTPEQTQEEVQRMHSEGFVIGVIADTLGLSDSYVRRLLQPSRR